MLATTVENTVDTALDPVLAVQATVDCTMHTDCNQVRTVQTAVDEMMVIDMQQTEAAVAMHNLLLTSAVLVPRQAGTRAGTRSC